MNASFNGPHAAVPGPRAAGRSGGIGLDDNVYQSLLANRIIFLGSEVRDENANAICAQMLLLNAEDPHRTSSSTSTPRAAPSTRAWRSTTP